ncbi:hypothetical protein KIN20_003585 [Parelaphostrongylus tenuis]|uniref:Uncharacterized protein n=1 Tax=Parelaphostrongylus tenuis TaxID=148309 RepID=A0AAD5QEI7_PARTN|nr:hypothetical protein KIN20_003585 [Parelaphostrongylus tenuis]
MSAHSTVQKGKWRISVAPHLVAEVGFSHSCENVIVILLECWVDLPGDIGKLPHCVIFGSTITALCTAVPNGQVQNCKLSDNMGIAAISPEHRSISGTHTTTNIVMANWSREVWHIVVNRAVRMLASSPLRSHFFSAIATVG